MGKDTRTYEQRKEYNRQWRERNKAKIKELGRKDYEKHKEARLAKNAAWREAHKGYNRFRKRRWIREHHLKEYGVTKELYEQLRERLNGPCEICGSMEKMYLDHCHTKNVFRGLLCHRCNSGLGYFKDNVPSLKAAITYLESR